MSETSVSVVLKAIFCGLHLGVVFAWSFSRSELTHKFREAFDIENDFMQISKKTVEEKMRPMKQIKNMIILLMLISSLAWANPRGGTALLPFVSVGVEEPVLYSAETLLRHELTGVSTIKLISEEATRQVVGETICAEAPCALELGNQLQAGHVIVGKMVALGEKLIIEYMLIDVQSQEILVLDKATASFVEDLDVVMKRVASSIITNKSLEKTAEVGLITESETVVPRRRSMRKFTSYSFGYLYPQNGYDDRGRSFAMDLRFGAEMDEYEIGLQLGVRKGFAVNIFGARMLTKTDFSPYIGGAFGFHWVNHEFFDSGYYDYENNVYVQGEEKRKDGFELTLNSGVRAFRTYNFQLLLNLGYSMTFNDFNDRAVLFTIGIIR